MSAISVRLPDSLHVGVRDLARREGISINQFIASAVAEKIAALDTEAYLVERAARGDRARFDAALAKIADREPAEDDLPAA